MDPKNNHTLQEAADAPEVANSVGGTVSSVEKRETSMGELAPEVGSWSSPGESIEVVHNPENSTWEDESGGESEGGLVEPENLSYRGKRIDTDHNLGVTRENPTAEGDH